MLKPFLAFFTIFVLACGATEPSVFDMMGDEQSQKVIKPAPQTPAQKPNLQNRAPNTQNRTPSQTQSTATQNRAPVVQSQAVSNQGGTHLRQPIPQNIAPTNEPELNLKDSQLYERVQPNDIIIKALNTPKQVYVGQIFSFTLSVDIQDNIAVDLQTILPETENLKWLSSNLRWDNDGKGVYKAQIYAEASAEAVKSPKITVNLKRNGEFFQTANLTFSLPKIVALKSGEKYNHVVAQNLEVKKYKTNKFDDKNLIMIVEVNAQKGNIADFFIEDKDIIKQGVDSTSGEFDAQSGYYFAIFSPEKTSIDFNYFSLAKKDFVSFSLPVVVEDDEISTQIGLNPKQSKFEIYKNIGVYALFGIFLITFLFKRDAIFLVVVVGLGAYILYSYNPFGGATLRQNKNVKILPTQNSSVFYTSKAEEKIEILGEREDYVKILLDDGKIGWVKKDDIF